MAEFTYRDVEECRIAADRLALFFAGMPETEVASAMPRLQAHMQAGITERFGADLAAIIAQDLVAAVVARLREIEAAGAPPPVLN
jgi:hypothetical protein